MIDVDPETTAVLERFGFDEAVFEGLRARVAAGELSTESNLVQGSIEPPRTQPERRWIKPRAGSSERCR